MGQMHSPWSLAAPLPPGVYPPHYGYAPDHDYPPSQRRRVAGGSYGHRLDGFDDDDDGELEEEEESGSEESSGLEGEADEEGGAGATAHASGNSGYKNYIAVTNLPTIIDGSQESMEHLHNFVVNMLKLYSIDVDKVKLSSRTPATDQQQQQQHGAVEAGQDAPAAAGADAANEEEAGQEAGLARSFQGGSPGTSVRTGSQMRVLIRLRDPSQIPDALQILSYIKMPPISKRIKAAAAKAAAARAENARAHANARSGAAGPKAVARRRASDPVRYVNLEQPSGGTALIRRRSSGEAPGQAAPYPLTSPPAQSLRRRRSQDVPPPPWGAFGSNGRAAAFARPLISAAPPYGYGYYYPPPPYALPHSKTYPASILKSSGARFYDHGQQYHQHEEEEEEEEEEGEEEEEYGAPDADGDWVDPSSYGGARGYPGELANGRYGLGRVHGSQRDGERRPDQAAARPARNGRSTQAAALPGTQPPGKHYGGESKDMFVCHWSYHEICSV